jgi:hypothetical protein
VSETKRRRFCVPEIALGALLATALWLVVLVVAPSAIFQHDPQQHSTTEQLDHKGAKGSAEERIVDYTWWLAWLTGILAASTVGLWGVTYFTLRHGRESAQRQLRAYMSVRRATLMDAAGTQEGRVILENNGETPARYVRGWISVGPQNYPTAESVFARRQHPIVSQATVGKGRRAILQAKLANPLTDFEKSAIAHGHAAIYMFGEVTYEDVFGEEWVTPFRFAAGGHYGPIPKDGRLAVCEKGNDAN